MILLSKKESLYEYNKYNKLNDFIFSTSLFQFCKVKQQILAKKYADKLIRTQNNWNQKIKT